MEQDLRGHFERALADEPPSPPGFVEAARVEGSRLRRRSRWRAGAGAGVLTLGLVLGINLYGARPGAEPVTPAPAAAGPTATVRECDDPKYVSVFLTEAISDGERMAVEGVLQGDPDVASVSYESREQAFERFAQLWKDDPDRLGDVGAQQLPESFRFTLSDTGAYAELSARLTGMGGVADVVRGKCGVGAAE